LIKFAFFLLLGLEIGKDVFGLMVFVFEEILGLAGLENWFIFEVLFVF